MRQNEPHVFELSRYYESESMDPEFSVITRWCRCVSLQNSLTPVIVANNGGQVTPGHKLQISSDLLEVKAIGQSSSDIIYTLVPTVNNPRKGEWRKKLYLLTSLI